MSIIVLTIIEIYFIKDIANIFKVNGIITILGGYLTIGVNYILEKVIVRKINFINVSKITDLVLRKTVNRGLILILIGVVQFIIYIIIYACKKKKNY